MISVIMQIFYTLFYFSVVREILINMERLLLIKTNFPKKIFLSYTVCKLKYLDIIGIKIIVYVKLRFPVKQFKEGDFPLVSNS